MSYAFGMRFDDDSNAITVIDEENQTATTIGYINGEQVDFSGGGAEPLIIRWDAENQRYDKTWQEVYDALISARQCFVLNSYEEDETEYGCELRPVARASTEDGYFDVGLYIQGADYVEIWRLKANSADSYLVND